MSALTRLLVYAGLEKEEMDSLMEEARTATEEIAGTVDGEGYSVSIGMAHQARQDLDMDLLVREAEEDMYREKRRYYQASGKDRRKR